jgi:uroporphyrinogen III methyltransferase/synthase
MSPLSGQRIVVTRPPRQARALCSRLEQAGAVCVALPTIDVHPIPANAALDDALRSLARGDRFDWVVFTSANGVDAMASHSERLGLPLSTLRAARVAAIGPATRAALREFGVEPDAMPDEFLTERIADVVGDVQGRRFLLLRADRAGEVLPRRLREAGAHVHDVTIYRTVERPYDAAAATLADGADAITFTSPSTVHGFCRILGDDWRRIARGAAIVTIGPVTSAAARAAGMDITAEADRHDADGLFDALITCFATQPPDGAAS